MEAQPFTPLTPMTESLTRLTDLTVWEAKERAGLLALETDQWREKRLIAEGPNTTADAIHALLEQTEERRNHPLILALAVHPNTAPNDLLDLLAMGWPQCNRAIFQNPILPFLPLEVPDFWQRVNTRASMVLLGDATTPVSINRYLLHHPVESIVQEAHLHIALAGELQTQDEARKAITNYWRHFCTTQSQSVDWKQHEPWHAVRRVRFKP